MIAKKLFPFLAWLPFKADNLKADFLAGLTVALVLVPQSMAYAQLAGLPAYYGLYAAFLPVAAEHLRAKGKEVGDRQAVFFQQDGFFLPCEDGVQTGLKPGADPQVPVGIDFFNPAGPIHRLLRGDAGLLAEPRLLPGPRTVRHDPESPGTDGTHDPHQSAH